MYKKFITAIFPQNKHEKIAWLLMIFIMVATLILDLWSKFAVMQNFKLYESREVIPDFFSLTYVTNPGAAWGLLAGKQYLLLLISLIVFVCCLIFIRKLTENFIERYIAIGLLFAGILGNSFDRLYHGEVIDFLDCYIVMNNHAYHWPIFNIADIAICCGTGLFVLSSLVRKENKELTDKKIS